MSCWQRGDRCVAEEIAWLQAANPKTPAAWSPSSTPSFRSARQKCPLRLAAAPAATQSAGTLLCADMNLCAMCHALSHFVLQMCCRSSSIVGQVARMAQAGLRWAGREALPSCLWQPALRTPGQLRTGPDGISRHHTQQQGQK